MAKYRDIIHQFGDIFRGWEKTTSPGIEYVRDCKSTYIYTAKEHVWGYVPDSQGEIYTAWHHVLAQNPGILPHLVTVTVKSKGFFHGFPLNQCIGWRENLNRKPWFYPWTIGGYCKCSLQPIHWLKRTWNTCDKLKLPYPKGAHPHIEITLVARLFPFYCHFGLAATFSDTATIKGYKGGAPQL